MLWIEVLEVLDALSGADVRHWVGGGWGVDALVGVQTRAHRDLDLAVDTVDHDACMAALASLGYAIETDWLPVRVEVAAAGDRWVDVHPVSFDAQGLGLQGDPMGTHFHYPPAAFDTRVFGGRVVPACQLTNSCSSTPATSCDRRTSTTCDSWPGCVPDRRRVRWYERKGLRSGAFESTVRA
ncbi:MAG: hypothetical protein WB473_03390 [Pedococcus sp.]